MTKPRKYVFQPGQVFGSLTVIKDTGEQNENRKFLVLCRCSCGVEVKRQAVALNGKINNSCGKCLSAKNAQRVKFNARVIKIGDQFNDWTIIGIPKDLSGLGRFHFYDTQCKCGAISMHSRVGLLEGKATSCLLCIAEKKNPALKIGDKIGNFTILETNERRHDKRYKCLCICGEITYKTKQDLGIRGDRGCWKCCHKGKRKPCRVCGCKGHDKIDLETTECDHLGFCEKCDKFDFTQIRFSRRKKHERTKRPHDRECLY